jgi:transcriptional regulator with XRE-family HTH domain
VSNIVRIHPGQEPVRRHFLKEWLESKGLAPSDLLDLLNDEERSMDLNFIDKSQVYRWMKGQMPQPAMQARVAAALRIRPEQLLRHPDEDWFSEFFEGRTADELTRIKTALAAMFPRNAGGRRG